MERARQEKREHLNRLRAKDLERLRQPAYQYAVLSHPNQSEVSVPVMPPLDVDEQGMWDDFDFDQLGELLRCVNPGDRVNPVERGEAEFYKALDRAGMNFDPSGKGFEEFDIVKDVDETLTNIMQDLGESKNTFAVF